MQLMRNITVTSLLLGCAAAALLGRCGSSPNRPADESPMDGGTSDNADSGVDGGSDGGGQPDGGNELDGGSDGGMAISFERDVEPIFEARCATSGCHVPPSPAGDLDLSADTWEHLVNQPTSCRPSVARVVPRDPAGSMLWRKTKPVDPPDRCGDPMPEGTPGLGVIAPGEFARIEAWIEQGALDN